VPGASNTLLRSLSYFPDAPMAQQWWTLMAWVAAGVALTALGHFRHNRINDDPDETDARRVGGESELATGNHPAPRHRRGGPEADVD
jgi:hypothetical protein